MFTFGAGGAGLSLHHRWEFLRPRRTFISCTYNEMEHEQAIGRAHRINSLSDTEQSTVLYRGTIEQRVLARRIQKGSCLNVVMQHTDLLNYDDADKILGMTAVEDVEELGEDEFKKIVEEED
jgi:SNF2 family DNA or RNA helicase